MSTAAPHPQALRLAEGEALGPAPGEFSLAAFERLQAALYGAVGADAAWTEALRVMAEAFDASCAMLVASGQGQRDSSFYAAWNHPEAAVRAYAEHWWRHDPWLAQGVARGFFVQRAIARGSDLVAPPQLRASAI